MHSVRLEPTKSILIGTLTTYQATGDAYNPSRVAPAFLGAIPLNQCMIIFAVVYVGRCRAQALITSKNQSTNAGKKGLLAHKRNPGAGPVNAVLSFRLFRLPASRLELTNSHET